MSDMLLGFLIGFGLAVALACLLGRRWARRMGHDQKRFRASQRLAELGTMTGGLAHEIKNPLSTIGLNMQLLEEDLQDVVNQLADQTGLSDQVSRIQRRMHALTDQTQRLKDILEDFLRFAGRVKLAKKPTRVNELIEELCEFFMPQAQASGVHLRTQFDVIKQSLEIDPSLFKQALLNLMINACHAMAQARERGLPSGGNDELIIRTQVGSAMGGGSKLLVHVTDTGPGMGKDQIQHIFLPYVSGTQGGTGLGLPTARRIIEEHEGTIECHSELGKGTDFTIVLPMGKGSTGVSS